MLSRVFFSLRRLAAIVARRLEFVPAVKVAGAFRARKESETKGEREVKGAARVLAGFRACHHMQASGVWSTLRR